MLPLGSAKLLSLVATAEKVSSGTRGVIFFAFIVKKESFCAVLTERRRAQIAEKEDRRMERITKCPQNQILGIADKNE